MEDDHESIVRSGEIDLAGKPHCSICSGDGMYRCIHCRGLLGCHCCAGAGWFSCKRCDGYGFCTTYEDLYVGSLHDLDLDGYRLEIWDTGRSWHGEPAEYRRTFAYRLTSPDGDVLFEGSDFSCPLNRPSNHLSSIRDLISFLTLKPGDTDEEYFHAYTRRQWEFVNEPDVDHLALWAREDDGLVFVDWDDGRNEEVQE